MKNAIIAAAVVFIVAIGFGREAIKSLLPRK